MNLNSKKVAKEVKNMLTYDNELKSLRAALKKADVMLKEVGFTLSINTSLDHYSVQRVKGLFIDNFERWITIRMIKSFSKDSDYESFIFVCEPYTMSGGHSYMMLDEAKAVVKYWTKLIKVCEHLNEMKLGGSHEAIMYCIRDIKQKERKNIN